MESRGRNSRGPWRLDDFLNGNETSRPEDKGPYTGLYDQVIDSACIGGPSPPSP